MIRRECTNVIRQMLSIIPINEVEFINALNWNYEDASYKAPEETIQWERTSQTLQKYIPFPPTEKWQKDILCIFSTMTKEELEKEILEFLNK